MEFGGDAERDWGWERDEGGGILREEGSDLGRPLAGNGGLLSDIFRGLSMSGKSRSTSEPGGGKSEDGLSLAGDRGLSGQRRRFSIIRERVRRKKRAWDGRRGHDPSRDFLIPWVKFRSTSNRGNQAHQSHRNR